MANEFIAEFQKNSTEKIRARVGEYNKRKFADLRIFYNDEDSGEWKPTRKGIAFSPELWPEFRQMVDALEEELQQQGLI